MIEVMNMRISIIPKKALGWWSVVLAVIFIGLPLAVSASLTNVPEVFAI